MNWSKSNWCELVCCVLIAALALACSQNAREAERNHLDSGNGTETPSDEYDSGHDWAATNDISNFDDCQNEFGTGESEDACNEYVKEHYLGHRSFNGYECTEDCSGHEAGSQWAEENDIANVDDCEGNSTSFIEGCMSYLEENH
jgi:hypothetical protein